MSDNHIYAVHIPRELFRLAKIEATKRGESLRQVILRALLAYIKEPTQ